jgi:hypothetical protein
MTLITPTTDLAPLIGVRVRIDNTVRGVRYTRFGVFTMLGHSDGARTGMGPHCGGYLHEEPHGDCRGGNTAFVLDYHDTTVEIA